MDYAQYVFTTFMKAGSKIIPAITVIVVGYFLFIKLPFWLFRHSLKEARKDFDPNLPQFPEEPKASLRLEDKIRRDAEELRKQQNQFRSQQKSQEQQKKEEPKRAQKKEEPKKEEPKREERKKEEPKRPVASEPSPESVFDIKSGEKLNSAELKSRYHQLLKESHPDRVASMGPDFKKLAEKKTKEINDAYAKLKKKAS